jgi:hypothetical protein
VKRQKYAQTVKTIQPWIDQHESVQVYLQRLNANKRRVAVYLYQYCAWAKKTPEELLKLKDTYENSNAEKLLDKFTIAPTVFPDSLKWHITNAVKAFYRANYRQLQSAAGHFEYVTKKAQNAPSKQTRLALFKACYTPRDRALVMASTCTAIARETMSLLRWRHFEEDWQKQEVPCIRIPSKLIKGHGKGKYRGVEQVSFLTPEAKRVFKEYRDWYQKTFNHVWTEDEHVFLVVRSRIHQPLTREGVSRAMVHISQRAGVKFGIHDGRIIVQTALENVGVSPQWIRKIKGRKVKGEESPYSKPAIEQLRDKYREALPELEFLRQSARQPAGALSKEALSFFEKFDQVLENHPDKFEKFEKFILNL